MHSIDARIEQLETQAAFNEEEIDTLSRRLIEQQALIDRLLSRQEQLVQQVDSLVSRAEGKDVEVEIPPHY